MESVSPAQQCLAYHFTRGFRECQDSHFALQPLDELLRPVVHQRSGAHHNHSACCGLALHALSQQCPDQCDGLQRLA